MIDQDKAIKIYARGGLGNQLFQYGAAFHLSHLLNLPIFVDSVLVSTNAKFNTGLGKRSLELNSFENGLNFLPEKSKFASRLQSKILGINRLAGDYFPKLLIKLGTYANEFNDQIEIFNQIKSPISLNSYCSTPKYFFDCGQEVTSQITKIKNPTNWYFEWQQKIQSEKPIGLNIRLGDYQNLKNIYGEVDPEYYFSSVELLRNLLGERPIWIFSDDPELAQRILEPKFGKLQFVSHPENRRPIEYLNVLANCEGIVCANSSFSWWGAYVASQQNSEVKVVFPRPMFNTTKFKEPFNWLPSNWITLGRKI